MKNHWIRKHKALISVISLFGLIGIFFNILYVIIVFWKEFFIISEIIIGFILSGIYFGIFTGCFIHYHRHFKKNKKWFSLKSSIIVGSIIFSFFAFYCNIIYTLIPISAGLPIQLETILIYLILGIYFGISSTFLVKLGRNFKPKKYNPERYIIPFKGAIIVFLFIFSFFAICLNFVFILVFHKIQIEYIFWLIFAGLIAGTISPLMLCVDPDDLFLLFNGF